MVQFATLNCIIWVKVLQHIMALLSPPPDDRNRPGDKLVSMSGRERRNTVGMG
ncbi:MAG: hypothetical protein U9N73_07460 [Candidatus Auribacterota bacterium]|nr:hypothetical protein [Candidatus Auribacterota bacterium]